MICKAWSCAKLTGMVDADLVLINHVSSSHKLDGSLHEVIIIGILGHRRQHGDAAYSASKRPTDRCDGWWWTRQT